MVLTPEQQSKIAAVYEKAAADKLVYHGNKEPRLPARHSGFECSLESGLKRLRPQQFPIRWLLLGSIQRERASGAEVGRCRPLAAKLSQSDWGRRGRDANLACAEAIYEAIYIVSERSPVRELA